MLPLFELIVLLVTRCLNITKNWNALENILTDLAATEGITTEFTFLIKINSLLSITRIADMSVPICLHTIPIFATSTVRPIEKVNSFWSPIVHRAVRIACALTGLIYTSKMIWKNENFNKSSGNYLSQRQRRYEIHLSLNRVSGNVPRPRRGLRW